MLGQSEQHQGPENTAGSGGSRAESGKQSRALSALGLEPRAGPWPAGHSSSPGASLRETKVRRRARRPQHHRRRLPCRILQESQPLA